MKLKWLAAAMFILAVAVSTYELSWRLSGPRAHPSASVRSYGHPIGPDLPNASELDETAPATSPVLTR
jgi:hypothetical protein